MKVIGISIPTRGSVLRVAAAAQAAGRGEHRAHPHNGTRHTVGGMVALVVRLFRKTEPKVPSAPPALAGTKRTSSSHGVNKALPWSSKLRDMVATWSRHGPDMEPTWSGQPADMETDAKRRPPAGAPPPRSAPHAVRWPPQPQPEGFAMGKTPVNAALGELRGKIDDYVFRNVEGETQPTGSGCGL